MNHMTTILAMAMTAAVALDKEAVDAMAGLVHHDRPDLYEVCCPAESPLTREIQKLDG